MGFFSKLFSGLKKTKDAIATIKRLWQESESNTIITDKDELNFQ